VTVEAPANPFAADVAEPPPPATTLVVFGGTGDLARRKLIPAIYNLAIAGRLPERFRLVGVARRGDEDAYRSQAREALESFSRTGVDESAWEAIRDSVCFEPGDLEDRALYARLAERIAAAEREDGAPTRRLFYLAVAPRFFEPAVEALVDAGLVGEATSAPSAVIVEKPFGHDLRSATELDEVLRRGFREEQIFRIDHYLGKEMTQNLLVLRFANGIFEPIWNRRYVDHVQITVAEELGVEHRGGYYDTAGALRDVIQNHALQLLALVAMEAPASFGADTVRNEKVKALRAIAPLERGEAAQATVRGQYGPGFVGGDPVPGYLDEPGVDPGSRTETYAALRVRVDNWRWAGTPFYLRSGKRLAVRVTEIAMAFRDPPHLPLPAGASGPPPNELVLSVQPNEGATLQVAAKVPGTGMELRPVQMDFRYGETFLRESPEAYERLLHDAMEGDPALFTRADEVEAAWRVVDPVLAAWDEGGAPLEPYEAGTEGPAAAGELLARDGRGWREL
jgi:glucose-6-phosphate 1-dehydrogenase